MESRASGIRTGYVLINRNRSRQQSIQNAHVYARRKYTKKSCENPKETLHPAYTSRTNNPTPVGPLTPRPPPKSDPTTSKVQSLILLLFPSHPRFLLAPLQPKAEIVYLLDIFFLSLLMTPPTSIVQRGEFLGLDDDTTAE